MWWTWEVVVLFLKPIIFWRSRCRRVVGSLSPNFLLQAVSKRIQCSRSLSNLKTFTNRTYKYPSFITFIFLTVHSIKPQSWPSAPQILKNYKCMSISSFWNYFNTFILYQGCVWLNRYTYKNNDDNTKGRASKFLAIKFWSHLNIHVCMFVFPCAGRDHSNASAYKLFLTFRFFLQHITRHIKFKTEQNFFHWRILSFAKSRVKETDEKMKCRECRP